MSREHLNLPFRTRESLELYDDEFYKLENTVYQNHLVLHSITFDLKIFFHLYCSLQSACVYAVPI